MAGRTWEQYERFILQEWPLTRREVQVAIECIKGKRNKEIASLLGIGAETVNKTLLQVYRAAGVNGRDQLVAKLLVADLENTPLEQSQTLAGEGAALVAAGFISTLYASRSARKRPRSIQTSLPASKTGLKRAATASVSSGSEQRRIVSRIGPELDSGTGEGTGDVGNNQESAWMVSAELLVETISVER